MSGALSLVSLGPGTPELIPPLAKQALQEADSVVGYELYLRAIRSWIAGKDIHTPGLTHERERAALALRLAEQGRRVALVSSGDVGVYAMAAVVFEQLEDTSLDVRVIPGITAATSCAALLGSPLSHDFATLSLSDRLCPWAWIAQRAEHIARADLCCVLYNVQSRGRPDGVYRVLRILLQHKHPDTWCGVVRNAFREPSEVSLERLGELPQRRFDMLTTIVIGNRFTQRKGRWLATPRGYGGWSASLKHDVSVPEAAVWVFAGTRDGNVIARRLCEQGLRVVISAATQAGAEQARQACPAAHVIHGSIGREARARALRDRRARMVVDATHPFASRISQQLVDICREAQLSYLRYERPRVAPELNRLGSGDAADIAVRKGRRILMTSGLSTLDTFLRRPGAERREWFLRIPPDPDGIRQAEQLGIPRARICAMQGSLDAELEKALWRAWGIDCVVTKDSGHAGGLTIKAQAAEALGIPLLVLRRPTVAYPQCIDDPDAVIERVREQLEGRS